MKKLQYSPRAKRQASTLIALGTSERDAAENLINAGLYREAIVHLYFTCFYVSQAMLCHVIKPQPTHLHVQTHDQRNEFNYRTTHTPDPDVLKQQLRTLSAYVKFALGVVPLVEVVDLLRGFAEHNPKSIRDFSFDVYCPKTYSHHTRLTFWQPPSISISLVSNRLRPEQLACCVVYASEDRRTTSLASTVA